MTGLLGSAEYDSLECVPVEKLAGLFDKSESWVYTMARQGKIPAVRVGGGWLFPRRLLERWMEGASDVEAVGSRARVDRLGAGSRARGGARR